VADPAHQMQAITEGVAAPTIVDGAEQVDFLGKSFRMADRIGLMPLMKFAHAASAGLDSDDMAGLVAMYEMIRDCVHPEDWPRFEQHAVEERADSEQLMALVGRVIETLSARPTRRPTDSSVGPQPTSPNLTVPSSSWATQAGTGDLMSVDELMKRAGA
jgi:hypothetical protein